jgi:hypothetical protein
MYCLNLQEGHNSSIHVKYQGKDDSERISQANEGSKNRLGNVDKITTTIFLIEH